MFHGELDLLAYVEQEAVVGGVPVGQRHVAAKDAGCDHPGEVDRILGAAERRRVAELDLLEVVHGRAQLDRQGELADPLVDTVLADRLCSEHASVGLAEQDLHRDRLGARVVPGVRVRDRGRSSRSRCRRARLSVFSLAPVQATAAPNSSTTAVPCVPRKRESRPAITSAAIRAWRFAGPASAIRLHSPVTKSLHLDGVADGEDVGVAGAHLLVDADPAELADLDPGHLRKRGIGPHAEREDHEVGRIALAGLRRHGERVVL